MCGIVGFLGTSGMGDEALAKLAESMATCLAHRGPDDKGTWVDERVGLGLGHRRLSILDLSPAGHQPMVSHCGRYVITFNGETYNYLDLRRELESSGAVRTWRGSSDTEVILAAIARWGIGSTLERITGMFALAVWDRAESTLHIARDRLGEKPLYYGWLAGRFVFASELKALRAHPQWQGEIDRGALSLFLRHGYVPAPYSIYQGVQKLVPGTYLSVHPDGTTRQTTYWSAREIAEEGAANPFEGSDAEAVEALERLLSRAVGRQMVADVPLGAFLSGGVDSSTVVALMQAQSRLPVKTFTIGFREESHNEAEHAKAVARHLGTEHTELYVTAAEARSTVPRLPELYDEPFSDASQIPTFLVAQLARRKVTVSLSGDGGDELFGGYNRYFIGRGVWNRLGWLPPAFRRAAAGAITTASPARWDSLLAPLALLSPDHLRYANPGEKLHKLASVLAAGHPDDIYRGLTSQWEDPSTVVLFGSEPATMMTDRSRWANLSDFTQRMMFLDLVGYLPDDILVKVDRAAMAVSLETRVPLLDPEVVRFAWRVPLSMKLRDGQGKWLLRQVLYKFVPRELIERPKSGFDVPIGEWLRGPLRDWAESLLDEARLQREGFFDAAPIRQKWDQHLAGRRDWQRPLWNVLMFQAWLQAENQARPPVRKLPIEHSGATSRQELTPGGWQPAHRE
jgi:asparagine synthase (glutamine-hydrolysing)